MSKHLLAISLGPIQDFIAAARRTRDLWLGSLLLSEVSKAAASAVSNVQGATLIFPAPADAKTQLQPLKLDRLDKDPALANDALNVANIILAELGEGCEPGQVAKAAEAAANRCWRDFADRAKQAGQAVIVEGRWDGQLEGVIECYCAWVPFSGVDYKGQRQRLMRLLAGRKALRDFEPWQGHALPKSSLDGARETVLRDAKDLEQTLAKNDELAQRLRLNGKEALDALGFTKRAATKAPFPSVVRVAIDPWLRGVEQIAEANAALREIAKLCGQEVEDSGYFAAGSGAFYRNTAFRYDGRVLFDEQRASLGKDLGKEGFAGTRFVSAEAFRRREQIRQRLAAIGRQVETIRASLKPAGKPLEPLPYYAILLADGDRMGEALNNIGEPGKHREFSQALAGFAEEARNIVNQNHGCLVYAGGDDVLAFVPLDTCIPCARELHDSFGKRLDGFTNDQNQPPTLSVGIAIGHCMEALEDMLAFARTAEKDAKQPDRNGLAVHLYTRGGDALKLRTCWKDNKEESLDGRLREWARLHQHGGIPDGFAYELKTLVRDYEHWGGDVDSLCDALTQDALRLLSRKGKSVGVESVKALLASELKAAGDAKALCAAASRIADEVILARRLAEALRQAAPPKPKPAVSAGGPT